jgi:hypothetical protein
MTKSRFKAPQDYLRGAGQALGLDLLSFFAEDEDGNQQFEGFAPGFKTSAVTKGRGGVLAYKTPKTPTTTTEFSLTPERYLAPPPSATSPTTPTAKKAYDFFSAGNLGGPGFGAKDLEAAKAAGFSDEDVTNYLNKNQQFFGTGRLSVAQGIIDSLKLNQSLNNPDVERDVNAGLYGSGASGYGLVRMANPAKFANPQQTQEFKTAAAQPKTRGISTEYGIDAKFFGGEDLKAARDQGFTDQEIKSYLDASPGLLREQNVKGGGGVYDQLNTQVSTPTASQPAAAATQPTFTDPLQTQVFREADREEVRPKGELSTAFGIDPSFFGGEDLEYARKQGFADKEIKDFLDKNISGLLRAQNLPGQGGIYDQLRV